MSDPGKSYHFELVCEDEQMAAFLKEQIAAFFVHAKIILRKQKYILYLKDSEEIIQILNVMEAHKSLMELENIRIIKEMRNSANRQSNCDSANITGTWNLSGSACWQIGSKPQAQKTERDCRRLKD